jgi:hypothetical protein
MGIGFENQFFSLPLTLAVVAGLRESILVTVIVTETVLVVEEYGCRRDVDEALHLLSRTGLDNIPCPIDVDTLEERALSPRRGESRCMENDFLTSTAVFDFFHILNITADELDIGVKDPIRSISIPSHYGDPMAGFGETSSKMGTDEAGTACNEELSWLEAKELFDSDE